MLQVINRLRVSGHKQTHKHAYMFCTESVLRNQVCASQRASAHLVKQYQSKCCLAFNNYISTLDDPKGNAITGQNISKVENKIVLE